MKNDPWKMADEACDALYALVESLDPFKQVTLHAHADRLLREARQILKSLPQPMALAATKPQRRNARR